MLYLTSDLDKWYERNDLLIRHDWHELTSEDKQRIFDDFTKQYPENRINTKWELDNVLRCIS